MPTDHERRYVRKPRPESRISVINRWWAFSPEGEAKGLVTLNNNRKRQLEGRGWTFKPKHI